MNRVPARQKAVAGVSIAGVAAALYLSAPEPATPDEAQAEAGAEIVSGLGAIEGGGRLHVALEKAASPLPAPAAKAPNAQRLASADALPSLAEHQRVLVRHLSRRYQVARESVRTIVAEAYRAGEAVGLDPLLLLAVISVESSFNPVAESVMGAKGLMQIIPRYHLAKLEPHGGEAAVLDPVSNIHVGAKILQEYVRRMGTLQAGLQYYNGALQDPTAKYANRVLAERERLERTVQQSAERQPLRAESSRPA